MPPTYDEMDFFAGHQHVADSGLNVLQQLVRVVRTFDYYLAVYKVTKFPGH